MQHPANSPLRKHTSPKVTSVSPVPLVPRHVECSYFGEVESGSTEKPPGVTDVVYRLAIQDFAGRPAEDIIHLAGLGIVRDHHEDERKRRAGIPRVLFRQNDRFFAGKTPITNDAATAASINLFIRPILLDNDAANYTTSMSDVV